MNRASPLRKPEVLAWLGLIALTGAAGVLLYLEGPSARWFPKCLWHEWAGLHCPGCGMTRAAHSLLHGEPVAAFRFNPLGMILLPLGLAAALGWIRIRAKAGWVIIALVLAFGVLRNLPGWPFSLLAPP